jgi:primosomal protein N' (replication factor Y)
LAKRDKIKKQTHLLNLPLARYLPTDADEAVSIGLPPVDIVDMREELKKGNRSVFSRLLQQKLHAVFQANEQALLFLNRRGTATFVMCRDCGTIATCPRCDTPLTFHAPKESLVCHYCGHRQVNPQTCPECGSRRIKHFGSGTEQIHRTLEAEFPQARILRWDHDTAAERGAHQRILKQFMEREADILVGTQMIAKGLDIPLVTLVGIISADTALGLPDYRVGERTFQLLTQVAGRAGRGLLGGEVVLQSYQPEHYAIQAAAEHDYVGFYEQEIRYRRDVRYPPFARLARLLFRHRQEAEAKREAEMTAEMLRKRVYDGGFTTTEIIGPTPCFFTRLDAVFRWQIVVRSADPVLFFRDVELGNSAILDIDPVDLL